MTIRDVTERPETLECGSNMIVGANVDHIRLGVKLVLALHDKWSPPIGYMASDVSATVVKILTSYLHKS